MKKYILNNKIEIIKLFISWIIIVCFNLGVSASPKLATKQQLGLFLNSKTCIVMDNSSISYNVNLKDAILKNWKITEYEFIDKLEFDKRRYSSKYSFLILMKGVYDNDPEGVSYNYLSLVLGDTSSNMTNMPEFCSIPLSYNGDNNIDYGYAMPAIINFMQKHIKTIEEKHVQIFLSGLKYYNNIIKLKDKELLINKNALAEDANTLDKIKNVYPYSVKLLTISEIQKELDANPTNIVFNLHVGPAKDAGSGKCFEMLFDTEGNLYYYTNRNVTNIDKDGFKLNDFNNIR